MRIVFAGTPPFAAAALTALLDSAVAEGWSVPLVLTQPDRPAGRGMKTVPSAVKAVAVAHGVPVAEPATLSLARGGTSAAAAHATLREARADVLVVAAYGLILPQAVLDLPAGLPAAGGGRIGAINIHASLLPRWRGAAPIARAIEAGDAETGITLMQMEAGLDTGPMLRIERMPIAPDDTATTLTAKLAACGAALLVPALRDGTRGLLRPQPQPAAGVTYAHKLDKPEAWLDWTTAAAALACRVRAFDPFPVACTRFDGAAAALGTVRVWAAEARATTSGDGGPARPPGTVLQADATGVHVACGAAGAQTLVLTALQRAGGRRLTAREFLAGTALRPGDLALGAPAPAAVASAADAAAPVAPR
jgi:methionyl-tRNA formyltransferase